MAKALITGVTGQDGAYLSEFLLEKGYEVYGIVRRSSHSEQFNHRLRWLGIHNDVRFIDGDLTDLSSLCRIVRDTAPDEVYNLGAQSFVKSSWDQPSLTSKRDGRRQSSTCLRRCGSRRRKLASIRRRRLKCSAWSSSRCRPRRRRSIHARPTPLRNSSVTG